MARRGEIASGGRAGRGGHYRWSGWRAGRHRLDEIVQVFGHVAGRRVTIGRPLGEGLQADALELLGNRVIDLPGRAGRRF